MNSFQNRHKFRKFDFLEKIVVCENNLSVTADAEKTSNNCEGHFMENQTVLTTDVKSKPWLLRKTYSERKN